MPYKDFNNWKDLIETLKALSPWLVTFIIGVCATLAQYAGKVRSGMEDWQWRNILLDGFICLFVAFLTHLVCVWQDVDGALRSILVALNAHMGAKAMMKFENIQNRFFGPPDDK